MMPAESDSAQSPVSIPMENPAIETPIGISSNPLPQDELELIQAFCEKLDTAIAIHRNMVMQLEELRSYYAAEYWVPKTAAAKLLNISDKRLRSWMDSDELKEGIHYYDDTPPGSNTPRWMVNVARVRKAMRTTSSLRMGRQLRKFGKPKRKTKVEVPAYPSQSESQASA